MFVCPKTDSTVGVQSRHGVGYFGLYPGFGTDLMRWIDKNYQPVQLIGNEPLQNGLFGIKILKR